MLKARDSVFWPGISNDICKTVEKCGICQASSKAVKPVGNVSDMPPHAWHTLGTDLFYWNKIDYLVIGDYDKYCFYWCGLQDVLVVLYKPFMLGL